ncbi:MAG TPA: hypothetical protein PKM73_06410 [Verrucomicrobiota bacterium]|nr:hypothetical protein [Verrucomicrobiota bacterium]
MTSIPSLASLGLVLPLSCQLWGGSPGRTDLTFHDGTAIPAATPAGLPVDRVGLDQGGGYSVTLSNRAGSITSLAAHVTVESPAPTRWTVDPAFAPALWSQPIVTALVVQGDGKTVVGGQFTQVNNTLRRRIVRLETDGAVDNTFDPGDGLDGWVSVLVLQPDGKILVGGDFERVGTSRRNSVARLHPDGSVDPTFEVAAPGRVEDLALLPSGQLLVAGRFVSAAGSGVIRVNSDGTLDPAFNAPASHGYESIALERSGTMLGVEDGLRQVTRLDPNGGLDQTFALGRILQGIALQPDDRILVGGFGVSRLNADGTLDPAWQLVPLNGITACLAVQSDGKVLVGGDVHKPAGQPLTGLVRLHADGTVDLGFDAHLSGMGIPMVHALAVLDRGEILVGGSFSQASGTTVSGLVRLLPDGSIDTGFAVELKCSGSVKALASLGPTNILVGGEFVLVDNEERVRLASFGPDGALNPNFDLADGPNSTVNTILPLGNDAASQVVLGGLFSSVNRLPSKGLVSLRGGVIGPVSILQFVSSDWSVAALVQQADGRLLVGGGFGVRRTTIPPTLALDSQFTTDAMDGAVAALASPDPSTLLVGGWFNTVGDVAQPALAKLKLVSTGGSRKMTLDTDFLARLPVDAVVFVLQVDGDGRYLVGGDFTEITGQACAHFVRINSDGTLDATFNPHTGPNDSVRSLLSMPGGRTLLAGDFTELGGLARKRLGCVRFDGNADPSFDPGLGANGRVNALLPLADGSLVVGGEFTAFDGVRRTGLARLVPQSATPVEPPRIESPMLDDRGFTVTVLTQPGIRYQLEYRDMLGAAAWVSLPIVEGDGSPRSLHDPNPAGAQRFYRVSAQR